MDGMMEDAAVIAKIRWNLRAIHGILNLGEVQYLRPAGMFALLAMTKPDMAYFSIESMVIAKCTFPEKSRRKMNFRDRKEARRLHFEKNVKGWKERPCLACNGSGYYDHFINGRTPKCSACRGTGREKYPPKDENNY